MIKTFIIHVSKGYEERRKHIDNHLPKHGINDYEYMLRGDIDDLDDNIRNEFFGSRLSLAEKSCFYKHYLVMKKVVDEGISRALVLEDDAFLVDGFDRKLEVLLADLKNEQGYFVNIEDAATSVPMVFRKPNMRLYLCAKNKLCGGYVYDLEFAKKLVAYIESVCNDAPIDGLIGNVRDKLEYNIYWTEPPLVSQGSKKGIFASELNGAKAGLYYKFRSLIKDGYRKHIRSHLSSKQKSIFLNIKKY